MCFTLLRRLLAEFAVMTWRYDEKLRRNENEIDLHD